MTFNGENVFIFIFSCVHLVVLTVLFGISELIKEENVVVHVDVS